MDLLTKWQYSHRLVGSVDPEWLVQNVILDSLCFLAALPSHLRNLVDIGSGAGIPGIPIAIVQPSVAVSLVESRRRRVSFLSTVKRELGLANVDVVEARGESLGPEYTDRFDAAVMRCAGPIGSLLPVAMRIVRPGGVVVVMASEAAVTPEKAERILVARGGGEDVRVFHRYARP